MSHITYQSYKTRNLSIPCGFSGTEIIVKKTVSFSLNKLEVGILFIVNTFNIICLNNIFLLFFKVYYNINVCNCSYFNILQQSILRIKYSNKKFCVHIKSI